MGSRPNSYDKEWIEMPDIPLEARITYLERRRGDIQKCRLALQSKDWEVIARVGHKIKGNAETFGFSDLTVCGIQLEKLAHEKKGVETAEAIDQFEKVVESLSAD